MTPKLLWVLPLLFCLPETLPATDLSVDAYLEQAMRSSEDLSAIDLDIQSLRAEIEARDLELSPTLALELGRFWDRRQTFSSNPEREGRSADLLLAKPFATGTRVNVLSGYEATALRSAPNQDRHVLGWEVGVSQSLWQNSFGRQTALRRRRDRNELHSRLLALTLEKQQTLIELEGLYWDLSYAQQEIRIRTENLERSRRILSWIRDRFGRSAAERTDLLQAQALVSERELELQTATDNFKTIQARLKERFAFDVDFSPREADLQQERALEAFVATIDFAPSEPVSIESLQARAEMDFSAAQSKFQKDRLKPVLEIGYAYGQQGADTSYSRARTEASMNDNDYHQIGVVFATPLDFPLISKARRAFENQAEARAFRAARLERQSRIQWIDLKRDVREQKVRVETALRLSKIQQEKSSEERSRYQKGRSTAFQAITFEQDAAESELLVLQLLAQLRRTESRARAYIRGTAST